MAIQTLVDSSERYSPVHGPEQPKAGHRGVVKRNPTKEQKRVSKFDSWSETLPQCALLSNPEPLVSSVVSLFSGCAPQVIWGGRPPSLGHPQDNTQSGDAAALAPKQLMAVPNLHPDIYQMTTEREGNQAGTPASAKLYLTRQRMKNPSSASLADEAVKAPTCLVRQTLLAFGGGFGMPPSAPVAWDLRRLGLLDWLGHFWQSISAKA